MNVLKHMEAIFVATAALAASSVFMTDSIAPAQAQPIVTSASTTMAIVVIKAKRMNAEEKLESVQVENAFAAASRA